MSELSAEANKVLDYLASMPQFGATAVPQPLLREILLYTEGRMLLRGRTWVVKTEALGAGIYRISLEAEP